MVLASIFPSFLISSPTTPNSSLTIQFLRAYKLREQKFFSWLKQTGEKLGYSVSRSNGQDGRPVPIREITSLVQAIISRSQSIPENLRQLLREVVSLNGKKLLLSIALGVKGRLTFVTPITSRFLKVP